jgi:replicative DNA helicase
LPDIHRQMPTNLDAEKGCLSSLLGRPDLLDRLERYPESIFYHPAHAEILRAMRDMRTEAIPLDFVTLTTWLKRQGLPENPSEQEVKAHRGLLDRVGGAAALSELFTFVPTSLNFEWYLEEVLLAWKCRNVIQACTELVEASYSAKTDADVEDLLEQTEARLFALRDAGRIEEEILDTRAVMQLTINQIDARYRKRGKTVGVPSGFVDIDRMLSGFMPEELYVVAGRPSQGKSAFAMNMVRHMLELENGPMVGLFSLEMPAADQGNRLLADTLGIDLQKFRDGFFSQTELSSLVRAASQFGKENRLHIDQTPGLSVQAFRVKARRMVKRGVNIIFVDYLQLMRSTSKRAQDNRQIEVAEISTLLKQTARELKIPIVALAQLTRDAENREPNLSMLRESGAIEQDADGVVFIWRFEKGEIDDETGDPKKVESAQAIIAKQRNGPIGPVPLKFVTYLARFESTTEKIYSNNKSKRQAGRGGRKKGKQTEEEEE